VADTLVLAVAVVFAGMGVYALTAPARVLAMFGVEVESAEGRIEVRAVYGGFGLAVAALLAVAAVGAGALREGILVAVGVAVAGMAGGRLVARVVDRPAGFYPVWFWFWVEVAMAAALLGVARA
jgi:hypothetical protein